MAVTFDRSRWPIVVATFEGDHDRETVEGFMDVMDELYARGERFVTVYDIQEYKGSDARFVKRVGQWYADRKREIEGLEAGMAMVIPSDTFRFMLSTAMLVARFPENYAVVNSVAEGIAWAEERLRTEARRSEIG